jgi:chromate transporter
LAAFVGFGLPAFLLMLVFSAVYQLGRDFQPVLAGFRGLQVIVIAIIINAFLNFGRNSVRNWRDALLAGSAAAVLVLRANPILAIVGSAAAALVLYRGVNLPAPKTTSSQASIRHLMRWPFAILLLTAGALGALFFLNRRLFDLAAVMLRVDLFAFGGGFASVPLMLHEIVGVRGWLDNKTFMDGIALGQVTPGPIVITATFVGYQVAGVLGAVVATVAIFTPSFLMVLATVPYFDRLQQSLLFRRAIRGVLASFVGLLLAVAVDFGLAVSWTIPGAILAAAALTALRLKADILWVVLAGAGIAVFVL